MGGSKQPSTTTQIQKMELPAWVDQASQQNFQSAVELSNRPYQPYTGERVAGLTPMEQAAGGTLQAGMDRSNSALDQALRAAGAAGGYQPSMVSGPAGVGDVSAGSFLSRDINAYMDPNINSVVNSTLSNMDRGIAQGQQGINDATRGAGAFGGSRHAVQAAVYGAEGERAKAQTEGQLRQGAFTDAANRVQQDNVTALQAALANQQSGLTTQGQGLQAQIANQNAGLAGAGLRLQGGQLALQTGSAASDIAGRNSILQSQLGGVERGINQAGLDANYQSFMEARDHPQEMLNMRLAALGMSPYGKTSTTTGTAQNSNSSNGLMTGLGAAATILPLLFSDKKTKKNIKRRGKVPGTDLNEYEFEYKKPYAGGNSGKQIGLMAQDVEKKVPGAVHNIEGPGGKTVKAVDYPLAILGGQRKGRSDKGKIRAPYRVRGTKAA